ncbi:MAG: TM2 domain-containing protein [Oscillospiraceae bacterium]|nr:TM2 domain-containing protein [Oscillospiraceae bacterium]
MFCKNCGAQLNSGAYNCQNCGAPTGLQPPIYCQNCGTAAAPTAVSCQNCGAPLQNSMNNPNAKSKIAAAVLAFILGGLGVHNFYLGFKGKAIAQLLISVLSCGFLSIISIVWAIVEGVQILTGSISADANGVPLAN